MVELIVEDGSVVDNANSYASIETIISYAEARGVTLAPGSPIDEQKVGVIAINAMDYIENYKYRWKGERVSEDQRLSWPRKNIVWYRDNPTYFSAKLPNDEIPKDIITVQCQLCIYISEGLTLLPTYSADTAFVIREKIGPLETQYSEAVRLAATALPRMPLIQSLLDEYIDYNKTSGSRLRSVRI